MLIAAVVIAAAASAQPRAFDEDFQFAWKAIGAHYAYFDQKATRWDAVPGLYAADLARVRTKREFVTLLERVVDELYDAHAQLNVNTPSSPRLVPSGADLWAEWRGAEAVVTEVRRESDAERAGIRPGDVVASVNDVAIADAVDRRMGRSYPHDIAAARDWALRSVLAGTHDAPRRLQIRSGTSSRSVELPIHDSVATAAEPVTSSVIAPHTGYIRFNNSLGGSETIAAFDRALAEFRDVRALILDLRDTPSGGNSTVARGILGRFVDRDMPYQKHVLTYEERETGIRRSWLELVSPRGPFMFSRPVVVLVDHWTGSMGEGLAIGFDAVGRGVVIGTPMAGLRGATMRIELPRSGVTMSIPSERLYHVNGTPREAFRPQIAVEPRPGEDAFIAAALEWLSAAAR